MGVNYSLENRTILIHDEINGSSISTAVWALLEMLNSDQKEESSKVGYERKPINIHINSRGGILDDAWSLIDIILNSRTPIYTYSTGYAHSSAFLIFIAGDKRFVSRRTKMLYHQPQMGIRGEYETVCEYLSEFEAEWLDVKEYTLERTKISEADIEEVKNRKLDWYIRGIDLFDLEIATDYISEF